MTALAQEHVIVLGAVARRDGRDDVSIDSEDIALSKIGDVEFAIANDAGETTIGRLLDISCRLVG